MSDDPLALALAYISHATSEAIDGSWLSGADLLDKAADVLRGMDRELRQSTLNPEPPAHLVCVCPEPEPDPIGECQRCRRLVPS